MPNSRFCLGVLVPAGAAAVGSGALVAGALVAGAGALVAGAAVGSGGVGAAADSGLPPQAARISSAITSIIAAALIRMCANGLFTINLLVGRNIGICSICFIVHEIGRMLKCARAEAKLIAILSSSDDAFVRCCVSTTNDERRTTND